MSRRFLLLLSLLISLLFVSVIWQALETDILVLLERAWGKLGQGHYLSTKYEDDIPLQIDPKGNKLYNPLLIATAAKDEYFLKEDPSHLVRFIKLTDWLINHGVETDSSFFLYHETELPGYELRKPWLSAPTQAAVMNALAHRASTERNLEIYAKAIKAFHTLRPDKRNLGVALNDTCFWYMTYPNVKPHYVLSGMLSVLIELNYYYLLTKDPLAMELFDNGLNAVQALLPEYDYHGYSYYDLRGKKATRLQHKKHIQLLGHLNEIRPSRALEYYHNRWQKADTYPVLWQMILNPSPRRVLAFMIPLVLIWWITFELLGGRTKKEPDDLEHS